MPINCYQCSICKKIFYNLNEAQVCELSHENNEIDKLKKRMYFSGVDICNYCDYSYYVYGCERDCNHYANCNKKNNYKNFKPVEPFHDKSKKGGI